MCFGGTCKRICISEIVIVNCILNNTAGNNFTDIYIINIRNIFIGFRKSGKSLHRHTIIYKTYSIRRNGGFTAVRYVSAFGLIIIRVFIRSDLTVYFQEYIVLIAVRTGGNAHSSEFNLVFSGCNGRYSFV